MTSPEKIQVVSKYNKVLTKKKQQQKNTEQIKSLHLRVVPVPCKVKCVFS